jgi:hypothetical protein
MKLSYFQKIKHSHIFLLIGLPLLLSCINSNWIFTPPDSLPTDSWFYFTNFIHFFEYVSVFPSNTHYIIERLTWNIPGYLIYHIFTPLVANYILHLFVFYLAAFSLYGIISILFDHRTALFTTLFMGSFSLFLRAVGWDYPDGAGIALMLFMLLLLSRATHSSNWKYYLFFAGIIQSLLLTTNVFWLGFTPSWIIYYLLVKHQYQKFNLFQLIKEAIIFIIGSFSITLLISVFYHSITGEYNFLKNTIYYSQLLSNNLVNENILTNTYWPRQPILLQLFPIILAIAGIIQLFKSKLHPQRYFFFAIVINFLLSYLWLILYSLVGYPYLLIPIYMSYLIPSSFLFLGALLSSSINKTNEKQQKFAVIFAYIMFSLPMLLCVVFPSIVGLQGNFWLMTIFGLGTIVGLVSSSKKNMIFLTILAFSFLSFLIGRNAWVYIPDRFQNQNNFLSLMDATESIDNYYPSAKYGDYRIWFRWDKNITTYVALQSIYLYPWGSSINILPNSEEFVWPDTTPIKNGAIILVAENPDPLKIFNDAKFALEKFNVSLNLKHSRRIQQGNFEFTLVFTEITINPTYLQFGKRFDFDVPFTGKNFYPVEINSDGKSFVWSGPETVSEIRIKIDSPTRDLEIKICAIDALLPEIIDKFQLLVNNTFIPTETSYFVEDCPSLIVATIPLELIKDKPGEILLTFKLSKTFGPDELGINLTDHRKLGMALDWLEVK